MAGRDLFYYSAGLAFLLMAKVKNLLRGYSTPKPFDTSDAQRCVEYDIKVVDEWLSHLGRYLGLDDPPSLVGKDVLELGPGSDLGVGIYLLSKGVLTYNACDVNRLATTAPDAFYEALFSRLHARDVAVPMQELRQQLANTRMNQSSRLNYVVRDDFDLLEAFGRNTIDLVFSQSAFEHFDDIDATVHGMTAVCRPGAVLVAQIDLKTHSRWIREKDPNNIYRFSPAIYRAFWFRGAPNRLRPRHYLEALNRHGWTDIAVVPLSQLPPQDFRHLAHQFRGASNQMELLSVFICARKPGAAQQWLPGACASRRD